MHKTIEAAWREGFLEPEALVAPKINNLYDRKSAHVVDKIQRMFKINEIAILVGAPVMWAVLAVTGLPYAGGIIWALLMGLVVAGRSYIRKFEPPDKSLDSYQYLKTFDSWLQDRMARTRRIQRHFYAACFLALMVGVIASAGGQALIRTLMEGRPEMGLVYGVPVVLVLTIVVATIVVEFLGGIIFDFDVNMVYRPVFRKLGQMLAEMEELRGNGR